MYDCIASKACKKIDRYNQKFGISMCSAQTVTRIGLLEEIPRSGISFLPLIKPHRRMRTLCGPAQTQV